MGKRILMLVGDYAEDYESVSTSPARYGARYNASSI